MEGAPILDGSEAFVTYGRGLLKIFNAAKNFGFISPVFKGSADVEGPPLPRSVDEGIWFFGNHSLPMRANPGVELTFEIWENASGKAQARSVQVASEPSAVVPVEQHKQEIPQAPEYHSHSHSDRYGHKGGGKGGGKLHPNEPRVIYPSVYVSDVPVEWNEAAIRKLHRQLGLNPDTIMGLKFLPFTEVSLGLSGSKGEKQATPVTGSVILRYLNEEAANAAVERLKGHPIQTSSGVTKHLGAKHATPPKWVVQRKQQEDEAKKITGATESKGQKLKTSEGQSQKVSGSVHRVSMAGYGVIKSPEWGEVLWRQYELPTNLRCLQFTDRAKFVSQVEHREDYRRLKEMVGKQVEAELYKLPDGQVRASHVRAVVQQTLPDAKLGDEEGMPFAERREGNEDDQPPSFPPVPGMPPFPGGPPPPGLPPGAPPFMDPAFAQMMGMPPGMPPPWAMGRDKKKKDKKDKKDKKEKKEKKKAKAASNSEARPKKRKIDDNDF
mmetsp:Transcript_28799/g.64916  ORF Transcript_28799/g.64916 Transcript_28799/m.64916 type:complete len:495 (+) Transcript_28799:79-1563(+)